MTSTLRPVCLCNSSKHQPLFGRSSEHGHKGPSIPTSAVFLVVLALVLRWAGMARIPWISRSNIQQVEKCGHHSNRRLGRVCSIMVRQSRVIIIMRRRVSYEGWWMLGRIPEVLILIDYKMFKIWFSWFSKLFRLLRYISKNLSSKYNK